MQWNELNKETIDIYVDKKAFQQDAYHPLVATTRCQYWWGRVYLLPWYTYPHPTIPTHNTYSLGYLPHSGIAPPAPPWTE